MDYAGWRGGDHIEAFGARLQELVDHGIVDVITPDPEPKIEPKKEVSSTATRKEVKTK